jgi:hypothetical protein
MWTLDEEPYPGPYEEPAIAHLDGMSIQIDRDGVTRYSAEYKISDLSADVIEAYFNPKSPTAPVQLIPAGTFEEIDKPTRVEAINTHFSTWHGNDRAEIKFVSWPGIEESA